MDDPVIPASELELIWAVVGLDRGSVAFLYYLVTLSHRGPRET